MESIMLFFLGTILGMLLVALFVTILGGAYCLLCGVADIKPEETKPYIFIQKRLKSLLMGKKK